MTEILNRTVRPDKIDPQLVIALFEADDEGFTRPETNARSMVIRCSAVFALALNLVTLGRRVSCSARR